MAYESFHELYSSYMEDVFSEFLFLGLQFAVG